MQAIEVPGEANPLALPNVIHALTTAGSSLPQQRQSGTAQLQEWGRQPGFHSLLQVSRSLLSILTDI